MEGMIAGRTESAMPGLDIAEQRSWQAANAGVDLGMQLGPLSMRAPDVAVNLEPVYGVGLAVLVLGEQRELGVGFYSGVAIILAAVLAYPIVIRR